MACRYEVTLNNVTMASLDSSILIHDVQYEEPQYERNIFRIANINGARTGKTYKERAAVTIAFEIQKYNTADRQAVLVKIINWAKNGGDLRINDRTNQKLICVCDKLPFVDSALCWTNELYITFAAYECPYWQSVTDSTLSFRYSASQTTVKEDTFVYKEMEVPGDAPYALPKSILIENIQNTSSSAVSVYVEMKNTTRNDGVMSIIPMLPASTTGTFEYSYDDQNIMKLQMRYGTTVDNLFRRYNESIQLTYDLFLDCGKTNNVGLSVTKRIAGTPSNTYSPFSCDVTVIWRGFWE